MINKINHMGKIVILSIIINVFSNLSGINESINLAFNVIFITVISLNFSIKTSIQTSSLCATIGILNIILSNHFIDDLNIIFLIGMIPLSITINLIKSKLTTNYDNIFKKSFYTNIAACFTGYLLLFVFIIIAFLTFLGDVENAINIGVESLIFTAMLNILISCSINEIFEQHKISYKS